MPPSETRPPIDWRAWLNLAWVVWFGILYGKMVVEQRGPKIREAFGSGAVETRR